MCRPSAYWLEPRLDGGPVPHGAGPPGWTFASTVKLRVAASSETLPARSVARTTTACSPLGERLDAAALARSDSGGAVELALERGAVLGVELEPRVRADRRALGGPDDRGASGAALSTVNLQVSGRPVTPPAVERTERT